MDSILWYDYETWGANPQVDRAVQFAGIRTDHDLNILEEPYEWFCQPTQDVLPHPAACLITGITPQDACAKGLREVDFIRYINQQMAVPGTCTAGYNSIRFDDEVTRHTLYRNLLDPYAREWQGGNSRWDLLDVVRLTQALRPEGIEWPRREDGAPSFRLEDICEANALGHENAHDAVSDVRATIDLARLIKQKQPKLFQFAFENRRKQALLQLLAPEKMQCLVHVSGRYPANKNCLAVVAVIGPHPTNPNGYLVFDLSSDPSEMIAMDEQEMHRRLFTSAAALAEGESRLPVKTVHINKAPVVAPISVLRPEDADRLGINLLNCRANLDVLKKCDLSGVVTRLHAALMQDGFDNNEGDPDFMLYRGDFFSTADRRRMQKVHKVPAKDLGHMPNDFDDERVATLLLRLRARNFPETLTQQEEEIWQQYCRNLRQGDEWCYSFAQFEQDLKELLQSSAGSQFAMTILESVKRYADELKAELQL